MAVSVNWLSKVITVPQSYLTLVTPTLYSLDVNQFRLDLKDIEDNEDGIVYLDTHRHVTEIVLSGVTYARFVEIINGYTIEFEQGNYTVVATGANHNIADVKIQNSVSLVTQNSAGLVVVGTQLSQTDIQAIADEVHNRGKLANPIVMRKGEQFDYEVDP